jgi:hypothetical protein
VVRPEDARLAAAQGAVPALRTSGDEPAVSSGS